MYANYPRKTERQLEIELIAGYIGCVVYTLGVVAGFVAAISLALAGC